MLGTKCGPLHDLCRPQQRIQHSQLGRSLENNDISWDGLWKIMTKFGCHLRFIPMVQKFHDGMQACVQKD